MHDRPRPAGETFAVLFEETQSLVGNRGAEIRHSLAAQHFENQDAERIDIARLNIGAKADTVVSNGYSLKPQLLAAISTRPN
jgi:hypothetical protein